MKQVKCIRPKKFANGTPCGFTAGVIYDVVDGKIIDDQGLPRPAMLTDTIETIEEIKNFRGKGDWEWIGVFEEVKPAPAISPFSYSV